MVLKKKETRKKHNTKYNVKNKNKPLYKKNTRKITYKKSRKRVNKKTNKANIVSISDPKKIVVFDLDETLGHFEDLSIFWDLINQVVGKHTERDFIDILDLNKNLIRPGILKVLNYVKEKRNKHQCAKIVLYTNNNGPLKWATLIIKYFESKCGIKFDKIIGGYQVHNIRNGGCRTSYLKSEKDLLRCSNMPAGTQICFIDDKNHIYMQGDNIYNITVDPYVYVISYKEMATKYYDKFKKRLKKYTKTEFINNILRYTYRYNREVPSYQTKHNSKMMYLNIKDFFSSS